MQDYGTRQTDLAVRRTEWRLSRVYSQASKDIEAKLKDWEKGHATREAQYRKLLADGKITQADFDSWMRGQVFQGEQWRARKEQIDSILLNADKAAANIINDGKLGVFADNANFVGSELENGAYANIGFTLYDQQTVARLIKSDPQMLPKAQSSVKKDKAYSYYNKLMNSAITQGIVQGESIPQIAKRVARMTGESSYKSAVSNARTAYTGAQNAGRIEGMHQAQELGINVKKQWCAVLDDRTRDAHADLDGQIQDVDKPFESELGPIDYPGDPTADPANVYNCRCALKWVYPDYEDTAESPEVEDEGAKPLTAFDVDRMNNDEYLEWQREHSTEKDIERAFYDKYGCSIKDAEMDWDNDRRIGDEWLSDIAAKAKDDLIQVQNGYGKCGYIQAADGSKAINAYLRRGEVGMYTEKEMKKTIDAMNRLIEQTTLDRDVLVDRCAGIDALQRMGVDIGNVGNSYRIGHAFCTDGVDCAAIVENINNNYLGTVIVDNGLMSASVDKESNIFGGSDVTFTILADEGRHAFVSDNTRETEIVFAAGTKQEILGAKVSTREAEDYDGKKIKRETIEIFLRIID